MDTESTVTLTRIIHAAAARKQWRSETEAEVQNYARSHGADKATVVRLLAEARRIYDEAGAGWNGRFQP